MKRILFYTNQFFGQIGGEEFAYTEPFVEAGTRGNANAFAPSIKGGEIVATIVCGDNYFVENMDVCKEFVKKQVEEYKPDILIAMREDSVSLAVKFANLFRVLMVSLQLQVCTGKTQE